MIDPDSKSVKVRDLKEGDLVDLESCPHLKDHPTAEYEFAQVIGIDVESDQCICIHYDITSCGYDPDQVLQVHEREDEHADIRP